MRGLDQWIETPPDDADPDYEAMVDPWRKVIDKDMPLTRFAKAVYKSTACGPYINFKINNDRITSSGDSHGHDVLEMTLDQLIENKIPFAGLQIGSYVEGSEAHVGPHDTTPETFWDTVNDVNREATFYWERDNLDWFIIRSPLRNREYLVTVDDEEVRFLDRVPARKIKDQIVPRETDDGLVPDVPDMWEYEPYDNSMEVF